MLMSPVVFRWDKASFRTNQARWWWCIQASAVQAGGISGKNDAREKLSIMKQHSCYQETAPAAEEQYSANLLRVIKASLEELLRAGNQAPSSQSSRTKR